jgi:hypothetical protein
MFKYRSYDVKKLNYISIIRGYKNMKYKISEYLEFIDTFYIVNKNQYQQESILLGTRL